MYRLKRVARSGGYALPVADHDVGDQHAVCDIVKKRAMDFGENLGVPIPGIKLTGIRVGGGREYTASAKV